MKQSLDLVEAFRYGLLRTRDGRIALYGTFLQVPFALLYAWRTFSSPLMTPPPGQMLLVHLSVMAGLLLGWLWFGLLVRFKNSAALAAYLILVGALPFLARLTT